MTCVATDGKTMAADSRTTQGDLITCERTPKLFRAPDGSVVGCAGARPACQLVHEWFAAGGDLANVPTLHEIADDPGSPFEALVLRPDGTVQRLDWDWCFTTDDVPAAIGSGAQVAIGAMLKGANPEQAVRLAARRVATVGGPVHTLRRSRRKA